jgi:hypothetical protein
MEDLKLVETVFNVKRTGNFNDEATGVPSGKNILWIGKRMDVLSDLLGIDEEQLLEHMEKIRSILKSERESRPPPIKDDKILTYWNGLMIAALAIASRSLGISEYSKMAQRAIDFIYSSMVAEDGTLFHRYREGDAAIEGNLDDYAFIIWGLLEMYEMNFDPLHLERAKALIDKALELFWDKDTGGFYFASRSKKDLISRQKESYDGAIPSGNSVMAYCLWKLSSLLGDTGYEGNALEIISSFHNDVSHRPSAHTFLMMAYDCMISPCSELVIVGNKNDSGTKEMLSLRNRRYLPHNNTILWEGRKSPIFPGYLDKMKMVDGKATAYVCVKRNCKSPTTSVSKMLAALEHIYDQ